MLLLQAAGQDYGSILLLVGMVVVFYFFMLRPQQKKQKDQKNFMESLKKGQDVITMGGIHGKIFAIEGDTIILEVEKGMKLKIEKSFISQENTKLMDGAKKG